MEQINPTDSRPNQIALVAEEFAATMGEATDNTSEVNDNMGRLVSREDLIQEASRIWAG